MKNHYEELEQKKAGLEVNQLELIKASYALIFKTSYQT